jgi:ADP-ribosylglycohydrolase
MSTNHKRNVSGMHRAPRCEAERDDGAPCAAPAVRGKKRCHNHGGKGSEGRSYGQQFGDYSKANLERDARISDEIKRLDKVIRRTERGVDPLDLRVDLMTIRRGLLRVTQQKATVLAATYAPSAADRAIEQRQAEGLTARRLYSDSGSRWPELIADRARGAMLGLATGEAVGLTLQGLERGSYRELSDMVGGGRPGLKAGQWAGDTSMALALMESLTWRPGFDETDLMERFFEMLADGVYSCSGSCVGIENTTKEALARYRETGHPIAGGLFPDNVDTGSLVRVAPVAICYWNRPTLRRDVAEVQTRTTHGSPLAIDACIAFADVLADAISGASRSKVLGCRPAPHPSSVWSIFEGAWKTKKRGEILTSNSILHALEAALWCIDRTERFEEAVLLAANLGGDAGTIAAATGQLAGAVYGASGIPLEWKDRLAWYDELIDRTDALFEKSRARD